MTFQSGRLCKRGVGGQEPFPRYHVMPGSPREEFNAVMAAFAQFAAPRASARWMLDKKHGLASASFESASRRIQPGERVC